MSRIKKRSIRARSNRHMRVARASIRDNRQKWCELVGPRMGWGHLYTESIEIVRGCDPLKSAAVRVVWWRQRRKMTSWNIERHLAFHTKRWRPYLGPIEQGVDICILDSDKKGYIAAGGFTGNERRKLGRSTAKSKKVAAALKKNREERRDDRLLWKRFCAEKGQEPTIVAAPGAAEVLINAIRKNVFTSFENNGYQAALDAVKSAPPIDITAWTLVEVPPGNPDNLPLLGETP